MSISQVNDKKNIFAQFDEIIDYKNDPFAVTCWSINYVEKKKKMANFNCVRISASILTLVSLKSRLINNNSSVLKNVCISQLNNNYWHQSRVFWIIKKKIHLLKWNTKVI